MRKRKSDREHIGRVLVSKSGYAVRPVDHKEYEDFNVYRNGQLIATLDTFGAAMEFIRCQLRSHE